MLPKRKPSWPNKDWRCSVNFAPRSLRRCQGDFRKSVYWVALGPAIRHHHDFQHIGHTSHLPFCCFLQRFFDRRFNADTDHLGLRCCHRTPHVCKMQSSYSHLMGKSVVPHRVSVRRTDHLDFTINASDIGIRCRPRLDATPATDVLDSVHLFPGWWCDGYRLAFLEWLCVPFIIAVWCAVVTLAQFVLAGRPGSGEFYGLLIVAIEPAVLIRPR